MNILLTIISALAILAVVKPVWAICAYVGITLIRPNELVDGLPLPAIPIMIVLMSVAIIAHQHSRLPFPSGPPLKSLQLFVAMLVLILVHRFLFMRDTFIQFALDEIAPTVIILVYYVQHLASIERLHTATMAMTGALAFTVGWPLYVHLFQKQSPFMITNSLGERVYSYGKLYDEYHYLGRLTGHGKGTWGNPNDFGMLTNMAVPGALYLILQSGSRLKKIIGACLLSMMVTVIVATGSRGSQLQLGVNLWMILIGGKRKLLGLLLLAIAIVGMMFVLPHFKPERADASASSDSRRELLVLSYQLFKENPILGVGHDCFALYSRGHQPPHNVYMQALVETGLLGGAIFFGLIFFLRRETAAAVKYFESRPNIAQALLARCLGGLQFSFFIFMLFSNQFMRFTFTLVNAGCIALVVAMRREQAKNAESR